MARRQAFWALTATVLAGKGFLEALGLPLHQTGLVGPIALLRPRLRASRMASALPPPVLTSGRRFWGTQLHAMNPSSNEAVVGPARSQSNSPTRLSPFKQVLEGADVVVFDGKNLGGQWAGPRR
jgi:hypothetical protein